MSFRSECWLVCLVVSLVCATIGGVLATDECNGRVATDGGCGVEMRPCPTDDGNMANCLDGVVRESYEDLIGTGHRDDGDPFNDYAKEVVNDAPLRCTCKRTCGWDPQLGHCFTATTVMKPAPNVGQVPDCQGQLKWRNYDCDPPGVG